MPIYQYRCDDCGKEIEVLAALPDPGNVATCADCGGKLSYVWSLPSVIYRGPGFYTTDKGRKAPIITRRDEDGRE